MAVEEDESLSGIDVIAEYVDALNDGDLVRVRELTDPDSYELADVFDERLPRFLEWRRLSVAERVNDCRLLELRSVGDAYECDYEREDGLSERLGAPRFNGTVRVLVNGATISSFQREPFVEDEADFAGDTFQAWVTSVDPELGARLMAASFGLGEDDFEQLFGEVLKFADEFMTLPPEERSVPDSDDFGLAQYWFSHTRLMRLSPQLWRDRLDRACLERVWDGDIARGLAEEFMAEDAAYLLFPEGGPPSVDDGALALWLTAADYCPDDFPPGAIEAGPPQP